MTRDSVRRSFLTLAVLAPLVGAVAFGQGTSELRGRVLAEDSAPIASATITLGGIGYSVRADSLGYFRLAGTPGSTLSLMFRAPGFHDDTASVVLERGREIRRDFVLLPEATPRPTANPSERVLRGRVTDSEGATIAFANIQLNGGRRYVSDDSGWFTMPIAASGRLSLLIRRIGFEPEEVKLAEMPDTALHVRMTAAATALPEQRVTATTPFTSLSLGGFYRRMADVERGINRGYFITPEDLEIRNPFLVTSAVEHLPNIRIRPSPGIIGGGGRGSPLNRNLRIEDAMGCPLTVYLDRVKLSPVVVRGGLQDEQINTLLIPTTLAGIEVYPRRAGSPPEFDLVAGTCGVVLLWTK